jgi:membrane protease YdiL (CAAX protease family)
MLKKYWGLSSYHLAIITLYLLFLVAVVILAPQKFDYSLSLSQIPSALRIIGITFACFLLLKPLIVWIHLKFHPVPFLQLITIALIFAIPEELLFRGFIQTALAHQVGTEWGVLFSALVFGLAHLPNGAKSFSPLGWSWQFAAAAFLGGLSLSALFAVTGSLLFPTLLHILFLLFLQLFVVPATPSYHRLLPRPKL